ncbi:hypothetical protein PENTCL1PPCAC_4083, partial [Pristionchus entomophagus]
ADHIARLSLYRPHGMRLLPHGRRREESSTGDSTPRGKFVLRHSDNLRWLHWGIRACNAHWRGLERKFHDIFL